MSRVAEALEWMKAHPLSTQREAADRFDVSQPAISAALRRRGGGKSATIEREACASIAEACGAPDVAGLIRSRGDTK